MCCVRFAKGVYSPLLWIGLFSIAKLKLIVIRAITVDISEESSKNIQIIDSIPCVLLKTAL